MTRFRGCNDFRPSIHALIHVMYGVFRQAIYKIQLPASFFLTPTGSRLSRLAILVLPFKSAFAQLWHKGFRNGR
jgi:hypothetical protein